MTRERHEFIVRKTMEACLSKGFSTQQTASAIVNKFMVAMELEQDEAENGVVDDLDELRKMASAAEPLVDIHRPNLDKLKPLPPSEKSVIIDPNSPMIEKVAQAASRSPVKLPIPGVKQNPNSPIRYWKQEHLREFIEVHSPDKLEVHPKGRQSPVTLQRNIEIMLGVDLVRLSYHIGSENSPTPSNFDPSGYRSSNGSQVSAMAIDTPVFVNFSCFEQNPNVDARMDSILEQANSVYQPRPETIASRTPLISGPLRWDSTNPNVETDKLPNPITGHIG